jgi:Flp pilus assembly protein TadG
MKGMPHAWRRDDAGAEAVEFAIIVPVLLALLTGIITFGFAFTAQVSITQAAREGARYAAICDQDATCLANVNSKTAAAAGVTIPASQITVNPCPAVTNPPDPQRSASVTITYISGVGIPPFAQYGLTLTGKSSTPCGG